VHSIWRDDESLVEVAVGERTMNQELCEYPHYKRVGCGEEMYKKTEFGRKYCERHWKQVLANREFMFDLWESKNNEKLIGYSVRTSIPCFTGNGPAQDNADLAELS
jgi:hypothetical protein